MLGLGFGLLHSVKERWDFFTVSKRDEEFFFFFFFFFFFLRGLGGCWREWGGWVRFERSILEGMEVGQKMIVKSIGQGGEEGECSSSSGFIGALSVDDGPESARFLFELFGSDQPEPGTTPLFLKLDGDYANSVVKLGGGNAGTVYEFKWNVRGVIKRVAVKMQTYRAMEVEVFRKISELTDCGLVQFHGWSVGDPIRGRMIVTAMERLHGGDCYDFREYTTTRIDGKTLDALCGFCLKLLGCLSRQGNSFVDFKLENVGVVNCAEKPRENDFRLIDVDSIGTTIFTAGYTIVDKYEMARVIFGHRLRVPDLFPPYETNSNLWEFAFRNTVYAVFVVCTILMLDRADCNLLLRRAYAFELVPFENRMELFEAVVTTNALGKRLWREYGLELKRYGMTLVANGGMTFLVDREVKRVDFPSLRSRGYSESPETSHMVLATKLDEGFSDDGTPLPDHRLKRNSYEAALKIVRIVTARYNDMKASGKLPRSFVGDGILGRPEHLAANPNSSGDRLSAIAEGGGGQSESGGLRPSVVKMRGSQTYQRILGGLRTTGAPGNRRLSSEGLDWTANGGPYLGGGY